MIKNYGLFEKYLAKISSSTISKFGSIDDISNFLLYLCEHGNIIIAAKKAGCISPLRLHRVINGDKYLAKCVNLALAIAVDRAEGVLYDRAINGYEEVTYNKDNQAIATKKKYCSKSLLEYLKANSQKYQIRKHEGSSFRKSGCGTEQKIQAQEMEKMIDVTNFEIESYEAEYGIAKE
ncbi:hypothetical protein [Candidatus Tisiphia endosymbiont of Ptychoptera albimana]|uniref:hypothetical protein n=1 Tax=Candidatus Tisiphia endosymbiont of Ptychoptera albimana TaxID=3066260 RepID=UPI001DAECD01|nr:hypothetical protein [Rickettsia endosymbiont of Sericostoma sp. HW-2014]